MNFRDFLPLAESLAAMDEEAAWRTAVSRAYYAAFHVAVDFLTSLGFAVPKADRAHGYLWLRLDNSGQPDLVRAGRELKDLRARRNIADYDRARRVSRPVAEKAIADAREIVKILDQLPKVMLTRVTDAIRAYERDVLKEVTWRA